MIALRRRCAERERDLFMDFLSPPRCPESDGMRLAMKRVAAADRGRIHEPNARPTMTSLSPADAARVFRDAVASLSGRLSSDYGELVPDASAERTAALLESLESGAG